MRKAGLTVTVTAVLSLALAGCGAAAPDRTINDAETSGAVALVSVYATGERGKVSPGLMACGHAYTSVENITDTPIVLGYGYVLPAGATVTIASWEFDAHGGVWFNIEPTYINQGWFTARKSVTRHVNADGLERINEYLTTDDTDDWTLFHNCTHFAAGLWNAAAAGSGDEISTDGMLTPSQLEKQILRFEGSESGRPHDSSEMIGYFSGKEFKEFTLEE